MILIQISAAQGPEECCLAVAKVLDRMLNEAKQRDISIDVIESLAGERAHTFRSVVLGVDGDAALAWAKAWIGNVQWTCTSPYRTHHPRKNWFIGIRAFEENTVNLASEIRYEACRANGPGGQHVNKTDSAIRATHIATGISVKVQTERSQHANKKIAALLIAHKLSELTQHSKSLERYQRHQSHQTIERGDAHLIFRGERFVKV